MSDLKVALEDAHEEISSGTQAGPAPAADRGWRRVLVAGVLLAVAAAAAAVAMWMDRRPPPAFELRPERFTADPRIAATPAISLDGTRVAYASDRDDEGNLDVYVQHISVGQPMRLTRDGADDYDPALSPDGSQVVFRSERDGGGLYIAETLGGAERRLVPGGRSPSFSPDGSTIAYLADRASGFPPAQPIFLVPARGGSPRPFQPGFGVMARGMRPRLSFPADGKHLAFSGWRSGSPPVLDWWIAPVDGGLPVATTAFPQYAVPRIPLLGLTGWHGPHLYFLRGSLVEGIHLFRAPLDPATWKAGGPARQLTSGGGLHFDAAIARDGTAVVAVLNVAQDFASLPIEPAQHGNLAAPLTAITSDATIKGGASVSRDGAVMAYAAFVSWETGRIEIRVRAVATGRETVYRSDNLASTANPQISPDGSLLAYTERIDGRHVSFIGPPDRLPGRQVCDDCQTLGIASDSRWALVRYAAGRLARRDLSTGAERTLLTAGTGAAVLDARLSPDDRWLALVYAAPEHSPEIYVAPVAGEPVGPERWQRIPGVRLYEESFLVGFTELVWTVRSPCPAWSADGRELYYFSDRDGHACIWAQRLDPRTKQPHGSAYPVHHLHRTETSPAVFGSFMFLAASRDRLIVPRWTVTGNLWTAKLDRP
jgi:Tol biopolymer transport system component